MQLQSQQECLGLAEDGISERDQAIAQQAETLNEAKSKNESDVANALLIVNTLHSQVVHELKLRLLSQSEAIGLSEGAHAREAQLNLELQERLLMGEEETVSLASTVESLKTSIASLNMKSEFDMRLTVETQRGLKYQQEVIARLQECLLMAAEDSRVLRQSITER